MLVTPNAKIYSVTVIPNKFSAQRYSPEGMERPVLDLRSLALRLNFSD